MGLLWGPNSTKRVGGASVRESFLQRSPSSSVRVDGPTREKASSVVALAPRKSVSYGAVDSSSSAPTGPPALPAVPDRLKSKAAAAAAAAAAVDESTANQSDEGSVILSGGDDSDKRLRHCTWQQAAFNIFFYMFGASQIPFAMGQMGWSWGMAILTALTVSSWLSGHYLTDICVRTFSYSWPDVARTAFGQAGFVVIQVVQASVSFIAWFCVVACNGLG